MTEGVHARWVFRNVRPTSCPSPPDRPESSTTIPDLIHTRSPSALCLGIRRYDDLRQSSGVTNATLSDRLKLLEENGLVERRQYKTRPDRFEYQPTGRGRDLGLLTQAMVQIDVRWNLSNLEGPPLDFIDRRTGQCVKLITVNRETSEPVERDQLGVRSGRSADALMTWRLSRGCESAETSAVRSGQS